MLHFSASHKGVAWWMVVPRCTENTKFPNTKTVFEKIEERKKVQKNQTNSTLLLYLSEELIIAGLFR
jgi:hypothetical protein